MSKNTYFSGVEMPEPAIEKVLMPDENLVQQYEKKYREFKKLHQDIYGTCKETP